jgi:hypothetical protein
MLPAEGWQISVIKPAAREIHLAGSRSATAVSGVLRHQWRQYSGQRS